MAGNVIGIIKCKQCEKDFETRSYKAQFCCDGCRNKYNSKNKATKRICMNCNKEFLNYKNRKCCSVTCGKQYQFKDISNKRKLEKDLKSIKRRMERIESLFKSIENKINKIKECKVCRKQFLKKTCSDCCSVECRKKIKRKQCKDKRITKNGKADYSINIERLNLRDNGCCHICKKKVDFNDFKTTEEGYFIAGNNYPSIDHVIAIANGGLHTWDNVKLAHRICNSKKNSKNEQFQLFFSLE